MCMCGLSPVSCRSVRVTVVLFALLSPLFASYMGWLLSPVFAWGNSTVDEYNRYAAKFEQEF